ncbi:hypothetical protein AVEN_266864-1 [Araneus ventricosus]|uniref:RING-type domain-containing protein n=1 Tax=Araneus ventricosus TaxID=182803 RepID=A0A4Y2SWS0_ARAVE|nr:hypothetical protein AVEN_266864-1 [Araneus ventricosus]
MSTCPICLELKEQSCYKLLRCGDTFHTKCIQKWVRDGNGKCPCCRKPFSVLDKIYLKVPIRICDYCDEFIKNGEAMGCLTCMETLHESCVLEELEKNGYWQCKCRASRVTQCILH